MIDPQLRATFEGKAVAGLERTSHVERIAQADDEARWREEREPERQRQARPRVLPAPQRQLAEVLVEENAGALPEVVEGRGDRPTVLKRRGRVPAAAEAPQDLVVEIGQRLMFEESERVVRSRPHEVFVWPEGHAEQMQRPSRKRRAAAVHTQHADHRGGRGHEGESGAWRATGEAAAFTTGMTSSLARR